MARAAVGRRFERLHSLHAHQCRFHMAARHRAGRTGAGTFRSTVHGMAAGLDRASDRPPRASVRRQHLLARSADAGLLDAVLLQGVLGALLAALGVNPNAIANALMLIALTTSAFFAYLLAARLDTAAPRSSPAWCSRSRRIAGSTCRISRCSGRSGCRWRSGPGTGCSTPGGCGTGSCAPARCCSCCPASITRFSWPSASPSSAPRR